MKVKSLIIGIITVAGAVICGQELQAATYESEGQVQFKAGQEPMPPLLPVAPDGENPIEPLDNLDENGYQIVGTAGELSLDYASAWDFGNVKISSQDEAYQIKVVETKEHGYVLPYVQVSDFRGTKGGWSLFVQQVAQFQTIDGEVLTGAEVWIGAAGWVTSTVDTESFFETNRPYSTNGPYTIGENSKVFIAPEGTGSMTWLRTFGLSRKEDSQGQLVTNGLLLKVPGSTTKFAKQYNCSVLWTLSDVPGNELTPIE